MTLTGVVRWAVLIGCVGIVVVVRPSLPLDGDEGRNFVSNASTSLAGLVGLLILASLWRASVRWARVLLLAFGLPLAAGALTASYFLLRG